MPQRTRSCHVERVSTPETSANVPPAGDTQCLPRLHVAPAHQWLHTTTGRITTDPFSWMQAVHWVHGSGHYTPQRATGPRAMNTTTLAVAQEIAALTECRPSVDYLARKLKASTRTIKYHLGMLREAGLLVYRSKGTRLRGEGNRASAFERIIPVVFDQALGIRTTGEGATRRPVGIADEGRKLIGKLAKKAARKTRRPRRRTPASAGTRCTPMQVGTTGGFSAAGTNSPPESKLASGKRESSTRKQIKRGPRTLNKVGRRYQLAKELIQLVPWLRKASIPRIAWIVRHVADNGWTALEVQAAAEQFVADREPRRPSAVLAFRLASCHLLYTTPARRQMLVEQWQDSRIAEQARHADTHFSDLGEGPRSPAARRAMDEAFAAIQARLTPAEEPVDELPPLNSIEDLTRQEVIDLRAEAMAKPEVVLDMIEALGERDARRLYTNRLVDQALVLKRLNARRDTFAPAF